MENHLDHDDDATSFESFFRSPAHAAESPLAWALSQRTALIDALRGLLGGSSALARLRLWCFLELAAVPQGQIQREDLNQLFHALQPQALDAVLKRLRDAGLIVWDATHQVYALSGIARQVHGLLAPLTGSPDAKDDELAPLLAQVAGAHALGLTDAGRLRHLHAQLARLHDDFADAIASGSEARLRDAQPRFERALSLVDRAGHALTALIRTESDDPRLEREARALGHAQARLLSMASQFTRAMQQADRQRVTLGSTGVNSSDVRQWLQTHGALHTLLRDALSTSVLPVFISQHDLMDVAEAEFERDRPDPARSSGLPPPQQAGDGDLDVPRLPEELQALIDQLDLWLAPGDALSADSDATDDGAAVPSPRPLQDAVLGGRFAQAAYRMQLLPLLGDTQAKTLQSPTGDLARAPWRIALDPGVTPVDDDAVAAISQGTLQPLTNDIHADT